jgi:hypothetical protein
MKPTRIGSILGSVGVVYGIYNGIKTNKKLVELATYSILFGLGGVIIGNAIDKFYSND